MGTSGGLNSAGPLIVRVRTEGLGGGRRWSVGFGGEGDIVGCWRGAGMLREVWRGPWVAGGEACLKRM